MLVATDVAARGIHVDDVDLVVHVDPPTEHKAYLHRSGRTARAGAAGVVVTVATHAQRAGVASLTGKAGIRPKTTAVTSGASAIRELTGPPVAAVRPAARPPARQAARQAARPGRDSRRPRRATRG